MELLVATLCDSASESQGKLNIIGAFDTIFAQSFPARFSFSLALRFSFTAEDHGRHAFSIRLIDIAGESNTETPKETGMEVNMPPGTAGFSTQNMITPLNGSVAKEGIYYFDIHFDERTLSRVPLRVMGRAEPGAV